MSSRHWKSTKKKSPIQKNHALGALNHTIFLLGLFRDFPALGLSNVVVNKNVKIFIFFIRSFPGMRSQTRSISISYACKKRRSYIPKASFVLNKRISCIVFTQADQCLLGNTLLKRTHNQYV